MSAPAFRPTRRSWRAIRRATAPALALALLSAGCRQASSVSVPGSEAVAKPAPSSADFALRGAANGTGSSGSATRIEGAAGAKAATRVPWLPP